MLRKIKKLNFTSAIGMGVTSSALKVEEKTPVFYKGSKIVENNDRGQETFRLYYITQSDLYEAVLYNPDERTVCLSVFRIEDERKARDMFRWVWMQCFKRYSVLLVLVNYQKDMQLCLALLCCVKIEVFVLNIAVLIKALIVT